MLNVSSEIDDEDGKRESKLDQIDIIGAVMLFPTVVDIAKSPSGKKLTVRSNEDSPFSSYPQPTFLQLTF